jgi:hypothetical protein
MYEPRQEPREHWTSLTVRVRVSELDQIDDRAAALNISRSLYAAEVLRADLAEREGASTDGNRA